MVRASKVSLAASSREPQFEALIEAYAQRFGMEVEKVRYETYGLDPDLVARDLALFVPIRNWHPFEPQRRENRSRTLRSQQPPPNIVKGLKKCACGNDVFVYYQMQLRSGDEGMTTFWSCTKCRKVRKS